MTVSSVLPAGQALASNAISLDLTKSLGPIFCGFVPATVLYGWFMAQAWDYFRRCQRDPLFIKAMMALLVISETGATAVAAEQIYNFTITDFGNFLSLLTMTPSWGTYMLLSTITIYVVQLFYVYKVHSLGEGTVVPKTVIFVLHAVSLIAFVLGIVLSTFYFTAKTVFTVHSNHAKGLIVGASSIAIIRDILIIIALHFYLPASRSGFTHHDNILTRVGLYSLNRGLILVIVNLCMMITYLTLPATFVFMAFHQVVVKLYANSLVGFLVAFEPTAMAPRQARPNLTQASFAEAIRQSGERNIHIEIVQDTDVDIFSAARSGFKSRPGSIKPLQRPR